MKYLLACSLLFAALLASADEYGHPPSVQAYREARAFFRQHQSPESLRRFNRESPAEQAMLLGNVYWHEATQRRGQAWDEFGAGNPQVHERARLFLQESLRLSEGNQHGLTTVEQAYVYRLLGQIAQVRRVFDQAEAFYRRSMALGGAEACANLGAMWEARGNYGRALKVYEDCQPDLVSPVLLMNLGAIHYNGLGVPQDYLKGAGYWLKSYALFGFDPDVNFNLGLYFSQLVMDAGRARFHFVLAAALGDAEAGRRLTTGVSRDVANLFAAELSRLEPTMRVMRLGERLRYLLAERHLDLPDRDGLTFSMDASGAYLTLQGRCSSEKALTRALALMFRLLYVDTGSYSGAESAALAQRLRAGETLWKLCTSKRHAG